MKEQKRIQNGYYEELNEFGFDYLKISVDDLMDKSSYIKLGNSPVRIDLFCDLPGVSFDKVYNQATSYKQDDFEVKVIDVDHLIQNKKFVGRLQDLDDVKKLQKILKKKKMSVQFSSEKLVEAKNIISHYPEGKQKSAILPVLHLAQQEFGGWLDVQVMDYVASLLKIEPIEVYEVATFYSMYNLKPVGRYMFEVCQTGPCMINGSDAIIKYIGEKLGIKPGETTQDGMFTLKTVECLGACGYAPMMQLGKTYREHLTKEKVDQIIEECRNNAANK